MPYDVVAYEADDLAMQLSEAEEGLFHRMLRRAWMNGSIPADLTELMHICRTNHNRLKKAWEKLSPLWKPHPQLPGRLINLKQESERDYRVALREQNRLAGVASAKVRELKRISSTTVERTLSDRSTSLPSPSLPNKDIHIAPPVLGMDVFESLWSEYPSKDGKKAALRSFRATVKTEDQLAAFRKALRNYKDHLQANPLKLIKNGSTFFNNWNDWTEWVEPGQNGSSSTSQKPALMPQPGVRPKIRCAI